MTIPGTGLTEWLGAAAGFLTTAAFLPQVIHCWRRRSARDLSSLWLATFALGVALWLAYGLILGAVALTIANLATLGLIGALILRKILDARDRLQ